MNDKEFMDQSVLISNVNLRIIMAMDRHEDDFNAAADYAIDAAQDALRAYQQAKKRKGIE